MLQILTLPTPSPLSLPKKPPKQTPNPSNAIASFYPPIEPFHTSPKRLETIFPFSFSSKVKKRKEKKRKKKANLW